MICSTAPSIIANKKKIAICGFLNRTKASRPSLLAWTLRFGFFAFGDPSPFGFVLLLMSMIVYGCAFDFFNISGSVFVEQEVNSNIRASAQGLFMTMVNGVF